MCEQYWDCLDKMSEVNFNPAETLILQPKHNFENYTLCMLFELKSVGKVSEEKYAASLGTKAKQIVLNNFDYFLKDVKSTAIQFYIYRVWDKHSRLDCNKNNNTKCKTL